ncbi:hypothetical protein NQ318_001029 [Aromia moschata]|uniref:Uncharacterized protein n=1 Tax=Aromia moschata TaxID=1265417 RepID=A0AAV8ZE15_9CUCU|nr:hypothetical protein NQ318_001029 [Aromia moschata]
MSATPTCEKVGVTHYPLLTAAILYCGHCPTLLQPLLVRLRIDVNHGIAEPNAKRWLKAADPELRSVVCKEALQWKKGSPSQMELSVQKYGNAEQFDMFAFGSWLGYLAKIVDRKLRRKGRFISAKQLRRVQCGVEAGKKCKNEQLGDAALPRRQSACPIAQAMNTQH